MDRRCALAAVLLLLSINARTCRAEDPSTVLPLAVHQGRCSFVLPTHGADDKYYLVISSLSRRAGPYTVTVETVTDSGPPSLPLEPMAPDAGRSAPVGAAREDETFADFPPLPSPPAHRVFDLFLGEQEFQDRSRYIAVAATLRAVGKHCQVYVDDTLPRPADLQPTVDDAILAFDDDIFPRARRLFGRALDVDRDGRFTLLFSPLLARLGNGKVNLGGFVRGCDFYRDVASPFGNRCDMMYLNTDLVPGTHLRTLVGHEYTHAIVFSQHLFGNYQPGPGRQDEESWLNEGLAHIAEAAHGYGWSNLDYRVSTFLNRPQAYALVVSDYYSSGIWRDPGTRGDTYLFLRWCVDRFGVDLLGRLARSNRSGTANLEAATGRPFAELFRLWSTALLTSDGWHMASAHFPDAAATGRLLCGPHFEEMPLGGAHRECSVAGTGTAYLLLHSPVGPNARITVKAPAAAELQVSLVPLPAATARLSVNVVPIPGEDRVRLVLHGSDAGATLTAAAWERVLPTGKDDTNYRAGSGPETARAWFGDLHLHPGETRTSVPVSVPSAGPLIFKVTATDDGGRHIAGWATLR
jgi:hypothetical protein